ncbi:MAG TPA: hypothetical protein VGK99_10685 [Acidobacteriota bacterium]|jgi:hypothetical protein
MQIEKCKLMPLTQKCKLMPLTQTRHKYLPELKSEWSGTVFWWAGTLSAEGLPAAIYPRALSACNEGKVCSVNITHCNRCKTSPLAARASSQQRNNGHYGGYNKQHYAH